MRANDKVFLLDVDNTLLDNDRFASDLGNRLELYFGASERARYFTLFADRRVELGFADYLGSLQLFRQGLADDPNLLLMSAFLLEYPFSALVYPGALAAVGHLESIGKPVILSDGDVVFQPRKVYRSGIWEAVKGRVLIYVHKEQMLENVQQRYPAEHYVMVDDKPNILAAMKRVWGTKLTTVFVRQGHYALSAPLQSISPSPDLLIETIGELAQLDFSGI